MWNTAVTDIKDVTKGEVTGLVLTDTVTGAVSELAVDGVFIGIGHTPNTKLFAGQLDAERRRLHPDARRLAHEHPGRVRRRRRAGSHLPPGRDRRRIGLHGGDGRGALSERRRSLTLLAGSGSRTQVWRRR